MFALEGSSPSSCIFLSSLDDTDPSYFMWNHCYHLCCDVCEYYHIRCSFCSDWVPSIIATIDANSSFMIRIMLSIIHCL